MTCNNMGEINLKAVLMMVSLPEVSSRQISFSIVSSVQKVSGLKREQIFSAG